MTSNLAYDDHRVRAALNFRQPWEIMLLDCPKGCGPGYVDLASKAFFCLGCLTLFPIFSSSIALVTPSNSVHVLAEKIYSLEQKP